MQGDTIVFDASRIKAVLLILLSAVMLIAFAFAPYDGRTLSLFAKLLLWLVRVGALLGIVGGGVRLIRPPRIELNSSGLIYITERRKFELVWGDIDSFTYMRGDYLLAHVPGMIVINPSARADKAKRFPAIPGGWDVSLAELTRVLNDAHARWRTP